jgi:hypothetical protein
MKELFNIKQEIGGNEARTRHIFTEDFDTDGFIDVLAAYGALNMLFCIKY